MQEEEKNPIQKITSFFLSLSMLSARSAAAALTTAASRRTFIAVTRTGGLPYSRLPLLPPRRLSVACPAGQNKMWTFAGGGSDQNSLVDYCVSQRRDGDVSPAAIDAMKAVDRKEFIGPVEESRANIYLVSGLLEERPSRNKGNDRTTLPNVSTWHVSRTVVSGALSPFLALCRDQE